MTAPSSGPSVSPSDPARRAFLKLASQCVAGTALLGTGAPPILSGATGQSLGPAGLPGIRRHRFGVNYVPSQRWYFSYNDWHLAEIERDLDAVAQLEADHIRVFLIWPWFQPNPSYVSPAHLDRFDELMRAARVRRLDVLPAVFTGWYGYHFNPHFYEKEPFYTSPKWAAAQSRFLRALAARLAPQPNFLGFDIGSEVNWNWPGQVAEGDAWMGRILGEMHAACPGRVHVNGIDHQPWFREDTFSPRALLEQQAIVPLHCWPFWTKVARFGGPLDAIYTHLPAAMAALARSFGPDPAKPIWLQEFGSGPEDMPEAKIPLWLERAVRAGIEHGVSWFTWWCSHDQNPEFDFHPFEHSLGLVTRDQRIKEQGRVFRELSRAFRGLEVPRRPAASPAAPPGRTQDESWKWIREWVAAQPAPPS